MRRFGIIGTGVLLALSLTAPVQAHTVPAGFSTSSEQSLPIGVDVLTLVRSRPSADAYVARIDPEGSAMLRAVSARDRVPHDLGGLEHPSDMCQRIGCAVAINADFRGPDRLPIGGVVTDGRMLSSPNPNHPQLMVTKSGRLQAGPLEWSGALRPTAGSPLNLTGVNRPPTPNGLVLFTPAWGDRTTFGGGVELVLTSPDGIGVVNQPSRVDLVDLRPSGAGTIPRDGAVLYASGDFIGPVRKLWGQVVAGTINRRAELRIDVPLDVAESVGANPVLLRDGVKVFANDFFAQSRHPRTLLGWNAAGEAFLVAVDGRQGDSRGMNLAEASELLLGLGATEGVNLDGGGGSTFVVNSRVINDPSDGEERLAVNILAVVARPVLAPGGVSSPEQASSAPATGVSVMGMGPSPPGSGADTGEASGPSAGPVGAGGDTDTTGKDGRSPEVESEGSSAGPGNGGMSSSTPSGSSPGSPVSSPGPGQRGTPGGWRGLGLGGGTLVGPAGRTPPPLAALLLTVLALLAARRFMRRRSASIGTRPPRGGCGDALSG